LKAEHIHADCEKVADYFHEEALRTLIMSLSLHSPESFSGHLKSCQCVEDFNIHKKTAAIICG